MIGERNQREKNSKVSLQENCVIIRRMAPHTCLHRLSLCSNIRLPGDEMSHGRDLWERERGGGSRERRSGWSGTDKMGLRF